MSAFNIVRFKVKPGLEDRFVGAHRDAQFYFNGFRRCCLVHTGERNFCFIGEWDSMDHIVAARPQMAALLDSFRDMLEDLGAGLGVTDPASGPAVLEMTP